MSRVFRAVCLATLTVLVAACSGRGPGLLEGTWMMEEPLPTKVTFRAGETEAMGMIEKVSYKTEGNDVLVTYEDGLAKGTTMRYTVVDQNTVRTELGTLHRVQ